MSDENLEHRLGGRREEMTGSVFVMRLSNVPAPATTEQKKMEGFQTHDKYNQLSEPRSIKKKPEMGRREEEEE